MIGAAVYDPERHFATVNFRSAKPTSGLVLKHQSSETWRALLRWRRCADAEPRFQAKKPACDFPEPMVVCTVLN
jgi:hypothetical protein